MTAHAQTIAVVGSTPFAWLLSGLLAADHSRAVVLVSSPLSMRRLRRASLSLAPFARPETLGLLANGLGNDAGRIASIAPNLLRRVNMSLFARSQASRIALSHMRHTMTGLGYVVEPVQFSPTSEFRVRKGWHFRSDLFEADAPRWLSGLNVAIVNSGDGLKLDRQGAARFGATRVDLVVLADDAAILERLTDKALSAFAAREKLVGVQTMPSDAASESVRFDLDTGTVFTHSPAGQWEGDAPDDDNRGMERLAACLPKGTSTRLAARTAFEVLRPHDNAPVIGQIRQKPLFVIAGLGTADIALAPMLARVIAGAANPAERQWADAHAPTLGRPRLGVAEFAPARSGTAA